MGGHSNQDPPYTQKPVYPTTGNFTGRVWFLFTMLRNSSGKDTRVVLYIFRDMEFWTGWVHPPLLLPPPPRAWVVTPTMVSSFCFVFLVGSFFSRLFSSSQSVCTPDDLTQDISTISPLRQYVLTKTLSTSLWGLPFFVFRLRLLVMGTLWSRCLFMLRLFWADHCFPTRPFPEECCKTRSGLHFCAWTYVRL